MPKPIERRKPDKPAPKIKPKPLTSEVGKDRRDIKPPWRPGLIPRDK